MRAKKLLGKKELAMCNGTVFVDQFTDGILDPGKPMLGPVRDYVIGGCANRAVCFSWID